MKFLDNVPDYLFFTGKGGVGKTSISCATAIKLAESEKKVLLVSTDPASNVGQVFSQTIGNTITPISAVPNLSAIEIDPQAAAEEYRKKIIDPIKDSLPAAVIQSITEQLSGACTTEIAAFDEFTGLLTDTKITNQFDHIIFDTAPTGHTIRLLQLPGAWSDFISDNPDGASCLGPMSGLEKQREQYSMAVDALSNKQLTRLILVARPQSAALREVARTYDELSALGVKNQQLIINGVFPESAMTAGDKLSQALRNREQTAIQNMPDILRNLPTDMLMLRVRNMVGIEALKELLSDKEQTLPAIHNTKPDLSLQPLSSLVAEIAVQKHGLVMLMGKGGVGKTTIAASIAVKLAEQGADVHLTTSDPAAHLENTLNGSLPNLQVSRIDPVAETERYRNYVLETKGKSLDTEGRALLEEDLRSPCTEEIAVFQAFSRIIREAGNRFVIMDTAPTGHTLLLLDATGAYHKEIAKKMGEKGHFLTPMMQLQDPERTKVIITTLAETTPVLEAENLQNDLMRAGIHPWAWVINNSLSVTETTSPLLLSRAEHEIPQIKKVTSSLAKRVAIVPLLENEPVGIVALSRLAD
ncbi:arsenical pump-driving ATPase [Morganella morganii subsp. morganii]|uniref:arsenical pump-driving ATPase n=1 Tax=Morganella morganii TaxID=582 RepID=UPI001BD9CE44|nr:arsenical pump-driving ATPase [Morganella morganii]EKW7746829.1 arsenical pump-driving ATPase [Morganella morganii]ELT0454809.1 arsenical pump-driving ATPase [Morganella morganii]MBT0354525.1 arsenical pump-driving ATPase [Morganella morganii subsp. morganii]WLV37690.1 arsenical pump-driving ATPase [Morganella morganii]